jgi:DNA-binding CsgD family transcriptional regulator
MHVEGRERNDAAPDGSCPCSSGAPHLTRRELDVLLLIAEDRENAEIAHALCISVRTVESHVRSMLHKLGSESRTGLVARCYATGVLAQGSWPPKWSGAQCVHVD